MGVARVSAAVFGVVAWAGFFVGGCTTSRQAGASNEDVSRPANSATETPPADAAAVPLAVASAVLDAAVPAPSLSALSASADAPLPAVKVANIGMHIGGGPNDALTKAPIANSVAPAFDRFRACWRSADDPARSGTFGVDLLIPAEGGRAIVSHPRTRIGPEAFRDCVVRVFEEVDFARPRGGRTTVSYSLFFEPRLSDAGSAP